MAGVKLPSERRSTPWRARPDRHLPSGNVDLLAIVCSQSMSSQDGLTGTLDPQAPGVVQAAALDAHSTGEDVRIWRPASLPHVERLSPARVALRALRARQHLSDIETGFYDHGHLNKLFNRSFGVTANAFAHAAASTAQLPRFDAGPAHTAKRIGPG